MSSSEFSKSATVSDSNIPVPKRTHAGTRRPKGCGQLPELQRYIETIIKASSECDSEDALSPEKGKKFASDRKFGRYSAYKGNDNRVHHEKVKFDFQMSPRKSKNKAKAPFTEAVSNGGEISSMFVCDFEDPRNWKTDDTQNWGSKPEIENFLKKIFPNPYHLESVHEVRTVDSDISPEKSRKDDLGDGTLAHVPISKPRAETEVESEKTDNASVTADGQINPCKRGSTITCSIDLAPSLENCARPVSRKGARRGSNVSVESRSNRVPTPAKTLRRNKSSYSTIDVSSRGSSLESVSDVFSSHTRTITPKRKTSKANADPASSKSSLNADARQKSSVEDFLDEISSDYDIGKLKLLSVTDSDDSASKDFDEGNVKGVTSENFQPPGTFDDVYESDDLSDLRQIFEVMNKATESFFELSLKRDHGSMYDIPKRRAETAKILELIDEATGREESTQESVQDERRLQRDENEGKANGDPFNEPEEDRNLEIHAKSNEDEEGMKKVESIVINLLPKQEKLELTEPNSQLWGEDEQKELSKLEKDTRDNPTVDEVEPIQIPDEDQEAGQKIDEVLQFMYDCLKKFSDQEKKRSEEAESRLLEDKKDTEKDNSPGSSQEKSKPSQPPTTEDSSESLIVKSYPRVKEIQSESSTFLDDTKRKPITRNRCRKKQDKNSPLAVAELPPHSGPVARPSTAVRGLESRSTADSPGMTSENRLQTVESQNELGSYSEQAQMQPVECSDSHPARPILPHSVKLKKSKTDTQKTIKDVLDKEEKLLANYLSSKPSEKKPPERGAEPKSRKLVVRSGRNPAYPFIGDLKRHNSNFLICVSSLPRNLRTMAANRTSLTLSPSLSFSLSDVSRSWDIKPLPYYSKASMKKIPVISDIGRSILEFGYNVIQGTLLTVGKGRVAHIARPVCLKLTVGCSKQEDEVSLKNSECLLSIRVKPIKKSLFVESSSGANGCFGPNLDMMAPTDEVNGETEGSQRVDSLLEALEKTEGRLMLLEQSEFINSESMSSCSGNETYKCDNSEIDWEGESGHEKVHDLLLRTYNLQHKLHKYLHKMTCIQPAVPTCPLAHHEPCSRFGPFVGEPTTPEGKPGKSMVACQQAAAQSKSVTDEGTTAEVQKIDHATSYNPPSDESKNCENSTDPEAKDEGEEENQNEDDDNSSVCSFKSSNDFSESNEVANLEKESKSPETTKSNEFLKKIFNEIESFKQNFTSADRKDEPSSVDSNHENSESIGENRLVEYDPKTPAKVLKTVFKGKKSMTELTIGLKDVPMTQVSNISVEKRKFSPNHTKISICILKEKPEALEKGNNMSESGSKGNRNVLRNKYSTLYFDRIRPSLSRCQTEYSRTEDDVSKTSGSLNESSDDDDDDYKSVASTFSSPDVSTDQKEAKDNGRKPAAPSPPKTFTKYRFDFYRKMDMGFDESQPKPKPLSSTVCRYKELEPLKQALTEMQIRMRSIKQDTFFSSNDYYERALKLAKMSAGYCQSCGNRAVIPKDTFGYYKSLLPRRYSNHRHGRHFKMASTPNPSYYTFRSSNPDVSDNFCDLNLKHSSSYLLNHTTRPAGAFLRSSLHDMPILIERMQ